jgi:glucan 1,3-beta-glucosidase
MPTLLATPNFKGLGLIDGSPYLNVGTRPHQSGYGSTNTFFSQIRNLVIDMARIPSTEAATGIHWPTAQTTSLQNIVFKMSTAHGTQHQGLFIEEGSGGRPLMTDLIFEGGLIGFNVGNQQFTTRNLTFNSAVTAINQIWDWGRTYSGLMINNCSTGLNISSGGSGAVSVGSITLIDSEINDTPVGIVTARTDNSEPTAAGSLYLENVKLNNVGVAIAGPQDTYMVGTAGSTTITAWADGNRYLPRVPSAQLSRARDQLSCSMPREGTTPAQNPNTTLSRSLPS